jgi:hypothetical protein
MVSLISYKRVILKIWFLNADSQINYKWEYLHFSFSNIKFEHTDTMKQPRQFLLYLCFLLAFTAKGQDNTVMPRRYHRPVNYSDDWDFNNRIAVKLTPSSLVDPYGALLPIGLEYYSSNKYGVSIDFGFPLYYVLNNGHFDYHKTINSDFKVRADVRQYFRFRKRSRMFFGAEVFYRNQDMTLQNSYFHFIDNTCYHFEEAKARKDAFGGGLIWGISQKLSNH